MKFVQKKYKGYVLNYYFQPGKWMSEAEIIELKANLDTVNRDTGKNLNYGIFDPVLGKEDLKFFLSKTNLCFMTLEGYPAGFFYNFILKEKPVPIIHAGLVMISKNTGVNLLARPYVNMALLQRKIFGSFYFTNISSTPSIVGVFAELFSDVWPSHKSKDLIKPKRSEYKNIVRTLYSQYVLPYFPEKDLELDLKRFVIRSASNDMGFDTNLRNLSRHSDLRANLFCNYWIDYGKGEDLIQVGWVGRGCSVRHSLLIMVNSFKDIWSVPKTKVVNYSIRKFRRPEYVEEIPALSNSPLASAAVDLSGERESTGVIEPSQVTESNQ